MKKVYCKDCKHHGRYYWGAHIHNLPGDFCGLTRYEVDTPCERVVRFLYCEEKNPTNECPDFEQKLSLWRRLFG